MGGSPISPDSVNIDIFFQRCGVENEFDEKENSDNEDCASDEE